MPRALLAVVSLYFVLGVAYSLVTPPFEASDEASHYAFVKYVADGRGLPVQGQPTPYRYLQEGSQPPLYYLLAAGLTFWIDTGRPEELYRINPHAQTGVPGAPHNKNLVLHRPEERWSWNGALGAVRMLRLLGVMLGVGTVIGAFALGRSLTPGLEAVAAGAAALTAFNPMALFIGASVNNDALMMPLGATVVVLLIRVRAGRSSIEEMGLLGLALGAAALTKLSGLIFVPLAVGVICWGRPWRQWPQLLALPLGIAALIAGWWYVRNLLLYGDPTGLNAMLRVVGTRQPGLLELLAELKGAFYSFWGVFGTFNIVMPGLVYLALAALTFTGLAGLILAWRRGDVQREAYLILIAAFLLNFIALLRWTSLTLASQGRLLFPTLAAAAALLALGLVSLGRQKWGAWLAAGAGGAMALLAAIMPFAVILPGYPSPDLLSDEAAVPRNTYLRVGDYAEMLGYELEPASLETGDALTVTLYWRGLRTAPKDYSLFLHLRDAEGQTLAQLDSYPGGGTYPTTWWRSEDLLRERYRFPVSFDIDAPQRGDLVVGWYDLDGFEVLPAFDEAGQTAFSRVASLRLAPPGWKPSQPPQEGIDYEQRLRLAFSNDDMIARPGQTLEVDLSWHALAPPTQDWQVFLHLVPAGQRVRPFVQVDAPLGGAAYPSVLWPPGEAVRQTLEVVLPDDLAPGAYDLLVGLYDLASNQRAFTPADADGAPAWAGVRIE